MILGRGKAQTDVDIIAEYHQFLADFHPATSPTIQQRLYNVPEVMLNRIGKPINQWADNEIVYLFANRAKSTQYGYASFLAFLLFRGYHRATLHLLTTLRLQLPRHFRQALAPFRQRLKQTQRDLLYTPAKVGTELNLLIYLLAVVGKPLEDLTRADFDAFHDEYQTWYRSTKQQRGGRPDARLTRLERYLVHWDIMPPARVVFRHEERFARLQA